MGKEEDNDADHIGPELENLLNTEPLQGLTDKQIEDRMKTFGKNEIPEHRTNPWLKFLGYFTGPISYLLELSAILSLVLALLPDGQDHWIDFGILVVILILNAVIGFHEEAKAESALDALKNTLALNTRAWRNGKLVTVEASLLVPGDIIALRLGDIVPADARLLGISITGDPTEGDLHIDQAALTGESLPAIKGKGDTAYSSSIVKQGQMLGVVTKTGLDTYIGRAANLISITTEEGLLIIKYVGHFQKIIKVIGDFLVVVTLVMVAIVFMVEVIIKKHPFLDSLSLVVVLTIAAIPVGLPTVMSVTMAVGANQLAKKQVIVKRLTAIEELASVSILCSDKTGTLTMNKLSFDKPYLATRNGKVFEESELLLNSYFASEPGAPDPIETAIRLAAESKVEVLKNRKVQDHNVPGFKVSNFVPFNPNDKRTEATVTCLETGEKFRVAKGAPQVIIALCGGHAESTEMVNTFAIRGLRALGIARTFDSKMAKFEMIGLTSLLDPPRPDSRQTILECEKLGINVKMITGDQLIIAKEVAHRLGMNRTILDAHALVDPKFSEEELTDRVIKCDGFAHVIPEHKYRVVELIQRRGILVGMTGDGVNDAPALKKANVGIAVEGCTDAARSAADIVLLASGLSTIIDGIKESRAIFQRMRSYALYRIASTIHFLLFFFISIIVFDFVLPTRLVLLICVLNDAATLVIAFDNARISKRPDKWRLGQLITLSFVLGVLLMMISFAHYFVGLEYFPDEFNPETGRVEPSKILQTIMYLQISSCPHFVIFSTRLSTWWWKSLPSISFFSAIMGTQVLAMVMSIYGVHWLQATAIGPAWGFGVLGISMVAFMFLDVVKVFVFKVWNYELTVLLWPTPGRRRTLAARKIEQDTKQRARRNWDKVGLFFNFYRLMVLLGSLLRVLHSGTVLLVKVFRSNILVLIDY
jgi:H+-transporting ATPase